MSIIVTKGDNSPAGVLRHWERRTRPECAREILRCWNEIEEIKARIDRAINSIASDKCSSDGLWAQGVNDATDKHAEVLRTIFSDVLPSGERK